MENTKIELKENGELLFVFPVSPDSLPNPGEMGHDTVVINGLCEILLKGKKKLRTLAWESFFPAQPYDFMQVEEGELQEPSNYIEKLMELKNNGTTVTVNITDFLSMDCVISKFEPRMEERGKDISYSISFTEDVQVDTPSTSKQTAKRPTKAVYAHMYKWKKGDTWKKVAKKETGDSKNYSKLKKANKSRINKAIKAYKKKHNVKTVKETTALIGVKVLIK